MGDTTPHQTLVEALAAAQGELKNAAYNATNPHLKNRFANVAAVRDAVVPVLSRHGIAVVQRLQPTEQGGHVVITSLMRGTAAIESHISIPALSDMQKLGAAITYARRYGLSALVCIASEEDTDGEGIGTGGASPIAERHRDHDDVRAHLDATAAAGLDALRAEWAKLTDAHRSSIMAHEADWWLATKRRAAAVRA